MWPGLPCAEESLAFGTLQRASQQGLSAARHNENSSCTLQHMAWRQSDANCQWSKQLLPQLHLFPCNSRTQQPGNCGRTPGRTPWASNENSRAPLPPKQALEANLPLPTLHQPRPFHVGPASPSWSARPRATGSRCRPKEPGRWSIPNLFQNSAAACAAWASEPQKKRSGSLHAEQERRVEGISSSLGSPHRRWCWTPGQFSIGLDTRDRSLAKSQQVFRLVLLSYIYIYTKYCTAPIYLLYTLTCCKYKHGKA